MVGLAVPGLVGNIVGSGHFTGGDGIGRHRYLDWNALWFF